MESAGAESTRICHIVAMPYPGRGHINPMMNLCKLLVSKNKDILVTFVVTEEWLGFIGSEAKPDNIRFGTIPNVIPSERVRAADMTAFFDALMSQMEAPFERLLDRLEPSPSVILADTFLLWAVGLGNRRNIKVSSFWPMSASMFSIFQHFHLLAHNGHFPVNLLEKGMEHVDYIPGVSPTRLVDFPRHVAGTYPRILHHILEAFSRLPKAQCITFSSIYELEPHTIDVLRAEFSIPIYTIGPAIPYFQVGDQLSPISNNHGQLNYLEWLDCQPPNSVLYISLGSFITVRSAQMDEIAAGLKKSGFRFLWVARGETERLKEECGDKGLVVPWCEQLRVLCHDSVGGFWSHCGWNSIREGVFGGVPFLALPLAIDQGINAKVVVEDWKVGWRVKKDIDNVGDGLVKREEIADLVKRFMDLVSDEGKEMRRRVRELQNLSHGTIAQGTGSSETNINAFIRDICQS